MRTPYFTHHEALARGCSVMALNSRDWQSLTLLFDSPHLSRMRYRIHLTDQLAALTQAWKCNSKTHFVQCTVVNIRNTMYTSTQLTQRQIKNVNSLDPMHIKQGQTLFNWNKETICKVLVQFHHSGWIAICILIIFHYITLSDWILFIFYQINAALHGLLKPLKKIKIYWPQTFELVYKCTKQCPFKNGLRVWKNLTWLDLH